MNKLPHLFPEPFNFGSLAKAPQPCSWNERQLKESNRIAPLS